jgi:glycerol-3-phosphate O-acyltransferase
MMRSMAWLLHKAFKTLYERVNVNEEMLEEIRRIEKNRGVPIVLLPTHRSSFDFLIVSYIFFVSKLRLPFCIQDESLLQSSILPFVANSCGAFSFDKAKYSASRTYKAVFDSYIELLVC